MNETTESKRKERRANLSRRIETIPDDEFHALECFYSGYAAAKKAVAQKVPDLSNQNTDRR